MNTIEMQEIKAAKSKLRDVLQTHGGDTKHEAVATAIEQLISLNPTDAPTRQETLINGNWVLMSAPNFPDGERREDGKYTYTLGRLAFNMFEPKALKLVIDRVIQSVIPTGNGQQRTYDIIVEFTTLDKNTPKLQGIVHNFAMSEPLDDTVMQVRFTGGVLKPKHSDNLDAWIEQFGDQSNNLKPSFKDRLMFNILKIMLGLVPPQGMDHKTGEVSFKMNRSPKGKQELLYLDEEIRITRGDKGTVLVCERQN